MLSGNDSIRNVCRIGIVEKSIQILRAHGKSDVEIRSMMLKDFSIGEETLDKLLKASNQ